MIIADTGPLVAYLDRSDQHHAWAKQVMDTFTDPLHTCDAVLAEATFLLQRGGIAANLPMQMIERGVLQTRQSLDHRLRFHHLPAQSPRPHSPHYARGLSDSTQPKPDFQKPATATQPETLK